jgi:pullulanase/glycogen debranching enzyme
LASVAWPGQPYPLGATWDGQGVNFALFSENAERVELCLFDPSGRREVERIELREHTDQIWHCYLPYYRLGQLYGYRVYGPYDPSNGHRFNLTSSSSTPTPRPRWVSLTGATRTSATGSALKMRTSPTTSGTTPPKPSSAGWWIPGLL